MTLRRQVNAHHQATGAAGLGHRYWRLLALLVVVALAVQVASLPERKTQGAGDALSGSLVLSEKATNAQHPPLVKLIGTAAGTQATSVTYNGGAGQEDATTNDLIGWDRTPNGQDGWSSHLTGANRKTYFEFVPDAGMEAVVFPRQGYENKGLDKPRGQLIQGQLQLNYRQVGTFNGTPVGALVTVRNIVAGSDNSGLHPPTPYMLFSDNLYSGVLYGGIKSMTMDIQFYDPTQTDPAQPTQFIDTSSTTSVGTAGAHLTFNSLNSAQEAKDNPGQSTEYAGIVGSQNDATRESGGPGQLNTPTILAYGEDGHGEGIRNATYTTADGKAVNYTQDTYFAPSTPESQAKAEAWNGPANDRLDAPRFPEASVTFALTGTKNTFIFGSTWGRAWTSFSSAAVYPIQQSAPNKTVEPLRYFDERTQALAPVGFAQRFNDDLDSLSKFSGDADHPYGTIDYTQYAIGSQLLPGHDPDTPDLSPGVLPKTRRYVHAGDAFYYFINQPTVDLTSQTLTLPDGYQIQDTLPAGTAIAGQDGSPDQPDIRVYDLQGKQIAQPFAGDQPGVGDQAIDVQLSESAKSQINMQTRMPGNHGAPFTVQIRVQVTADPCTIGVGPSELPEKAQTDPFNGTIASFHPDRAQGETPDPNAVQNHPNALYNLAASTFTFGTQKPIDHTAGSNWVRVQLVNQDQLKFVKQDATHHPLAGAKFTLTGPDDKKLATAEATGADGTFDFTAAKFADGQYTLIETEAPGGYAKDPDGGPSAAADSVQLTVLDGQVVWVNKAGWTKGMVPQQTPDGRTVITDPQAIKFTLRLRKIDNRTAAPLAGAQFVLSPSDATDGLGNLKDDLTPATASETATGIYDFTGLSARTTYYLQEQKQPAGYQRDATIYTVKAAPGTGAARMTVTLMREAGGAGQPETQPVDPASGVAEFTIKNTASAAVTLVFKKTDETGKRLLADAKFELTGGPSETTRTAVSTGSARLASGNVAFTNLAPGHYTLRETAAPAGYQPAAQTYAITVDGQGITWGKTGDAGKALKLLGAAASGLATYGTPIIKNAPTTILPHNGGRGARQLEMLGQLLLGLAAGLALLIGFKRRSTRH